EPAVGLELVGSRDDEQPGRPADEEAPRLLGNRLAEGRPERLDELALARRQGGIVELPTECTCSELQSRELVVQVLGRPVRESGIYRMGTREDPLRDSTGRRDHDEHGDLRLQEE